MVKYIKAEEILKDLSKETRDQIFKIAVGKLVYYTAAQEKMVIDRDQACI